MQASSPVVAGAGPATPLGMPRSRIVPTLLAVALAHVALIAVFMTTKHEPAPRAVQSTAIVAKLLSQQSDAPPTAAQSVPAPPVKPESVKSEPLKQYVKTAPPVPRPPLRPATPAPAVPPALAPSPTAAAAAAQPTQAAPSAQTTAAQAAAAASASATAAPAARETLAIAAPKHVQHADCRIVKPAYPELSRRREETGTAAVRFVIGTTGAIEAVTLVKSSGFPRLDDAAVAALRQSACQPYVENGSPLRVSYTQAFTFGLDDD